MAVALGHTSSLRPGATLTPGPQKTGGSHPDAPPPTDPDTVGARPTSRYTLWRALEGAALAVGAPCGWLLVQVLLGANPVREVVDHAVLYTYLLVPTALVFANFGAILGRAEDRLEGANHRLDYLSITDPLTGLRNVRYFRARMEEEWARANRSGEPLALAILDLDYFKAVNDRHGHPMGDRVLVAAATAFRAFARKADSVARIGGEEFAMIMPAADAASAYAAVERARRALARSPLRAEGGLTVGVTASAGVAVSTAGQRGVNDMFREADHALYEAKRRGRDRTVMAGVLASPSKPSAQ